MKELEPLIRYFKKEIADKIRDNIKASSKFYTNIKTPHQLLVCCFWWDETPEGDDFWAEVYENFEKYKKTIRKINEL